MHDNSESDGELVANGRCDTIAAKNEIDPPGITTADTSAQRTQPKQFAPRLARTVLPPHHRLERGDTATAASTRTPAAITCARWVLARAPLPARSVRVESTPLETSVTSSGARQRNRNARVTGRLCRCVSWTFEFAWSNPGFGPVSRPNCGCG